MPMKSFRAVPPVVRVAVLTCCVILTLGALGVTCGVARAQSGADSQQIEHDLEQAKKLGAKGQMPNAWWSLDSRFKTAREDGAAPAAWARLRTDARHLLNAARFINEMRQQKSGLEAMLGRFDQALAEMATLHGVELNPELSGSPAAEDLLNKLDQANLQRQVLIDSLTVENRRFNETVGERLQAQDETITSLQVELSALRTKLWETELRAGVAEADRSAAESVLTRKQQREKAVTDVRQLFGPDEAEILLTAEGAVVMRLFGVSFGVGSAVLGSGQDDLVGRIVAAVRLFPDSQITLEGHTDDTGGREANLRLSRRRAETVARLLEARLNWDAEAIATAGYGPDRPLALNSTPAGRAQNRRIDMTIQPRP